MTEPLTSQREAIVRQQQPGDWLSGAWTIRETTVDGTDVWQVLRGKTVLATLPDWAGDLALWIAETHEDVPELLATLDAVRAELAARPSRAEVLREAKCEVIAWLVKKAREGTPVEQLASKVDRGAIRLFLETGKKGGAADPLPIRDFYQPGHTYTDPGVGWKFRCDTVTTHPENGERTALGWRFFNGEWEPYGYHEDDWDIAKFDGTATTDGAGMTADEFNARYPVGTPVVAYPGFRPEIDSTASRLVTRTRSRASVLGGHTDVVWVEGHGACIALTHVDVTGGVS